LETWKSGGLEVGDEIFKINSPVWIKREVHRARSRGPTSPSTFSWPHLTEHVLVAPPHRARSHGPT